MAELNELNQLDQAFLDPFLPSDGKSSGRTKKTSHEYPFVTLTYASSLDSMIALAPGARTTLSGPETKCMTHYLRLHHDAILIGANTAVVDDPSLNCRYPGVNFDAQPQPVIVDPQCRWGTRGKKALQLALAGKGKGPWIFTTRNAPLESPLLEAGGGYVVIHDQVPGSHDSESKNTMSWSSILKELKRKGIESVMIEGGAKVIATLLTMPELIDSVIITIAPTWLGQAGVNVSPAPRNENGQPTNAAWLQETSWRQFGNDAVLCGRLHNSPAAQ